MTLPTIPRLPLASGRPLSRFLVDVLRLGARLNHSRFFKFSFLFFIGRDSFYVTNDHYFKFGRPYLMLLEDLFLKFWLRSDVIYFDGSQSSVAASGLKSPNGINIDKDGRYTCV